MLNKLTLITTECRMNFFLKEWQLRHRLLMLKPIEVIWFLKTMRISITKIIDFTQIILYNFDRTSITFDRLNIPYQIWTEEIDRMKSRRINC
jgi:hypothetical protein